MTTELKQILLKIARLPKTDQRWIKRRLSATEKQRFKQVEGEQLLIGADRFRKLKIEPHPLLLATAQLPSYCQQLAMKAPLYIAIVLEQGQYTWQEQFLNRFDPDDWIKTLLANHINQLKPATKKALFNHWQETLSFDAHLEESNHG